MTRERKNRRTCLQRLTLENLERRDVPGFLAPVSYAVGNTPRDVATADVNGDGRLDAVVAVKGDNNIAVLLGNGDGTLQPPALYPTGANPTGVAVADLNGDGKLDIVTANYTAFPILSVLPNNGDGTFGPPQGYGGGAYAFEVAIGDVDGDHIPDVALDSLAYDDVWVFQGNGDGTLNPNPKLYEMPFWYSAGIHIDDLDHDGVGDIIVDQPNYLNVIYSSGTVVSYPTDGNTGALAVADVNRDGWPDVVVGRVLGYANTVLVMLNRGDGTLLPGVPYDIGGIEPETPVVADFNRDRKPDIATSNVTTGNVGVILGKGDGTFKSPSTYPAGSIPVAEAVGDLNHDRYPDLVVANGNSNNTIQVLLNDGNWASPIPPIGSRHEIAPGGGTRLGGGQLDRQIQASTGRQSEMEAVTAVEHPMSVAPLQRRYKGSLSNATAPFAVLDDVFI